MDIILNFLKNNKFLRYGLVGSINTFFCALLIFILASMGLNYIFYTAIAYLSAMLLSFFLNRSFTFKSKGLIYKRLMLFFVINIFNLLCVEGIEIYCIDHLKMYHSPAILLGMTWYILCGFLLNQSIVFGKI